MKLKIVLFTIIFLFIGSFAFAQTKVYSNSVYGNMTVTFSDNAVYAVQGNMAVMFYFQSKSSGILNYYNQNYGTLLIAEYCLSYIMPNGQTVMFFANSSGSSSGTYTPRTSTTTTQSYELCYTCHGTGRCTVCKGSGIYSNYGYSDTCSACNGTGKCWHCYGSGKQ